MSTCNRSGAPNACLNSLDVTSRELHHLFVATRHHPNFYADRAGRDCDFVFAEFLKLCKLMRKARIDVQLLRLLCKDVGESGLIQATHVTHAAHLNKARTRFFVGQVAFPTELKFPVFHRNNVEEVRVCCLLVLDDFLR